MVVNFDFKCPHGNKLQLAMTGDRDGTLSKREKKLHHYYNIYKFHAKRCDRQLTNTIFNTKASHFVSINCMLINFTFFQLSMVYLK